MKLSKWNKERFSVYTSDEKHVLGLVEELGEYTNKALDGLDQKTDLMGDHKGSWQGLSKPTLSNEGLRATVDKIVEEDLPNINNRIYNLSTEVQNNKNYVNNELTEIERFNLNISMGDNTEVDYIYPKDKLKLGSNTWSYYDGEKFPDYYPSVSMDKNGVLIFSGNAQVRSPLPIVEGLVEFGQIYHFDITQFEGIPLRGSFIGVSDDDANAMIEIPFIIKSDGKIYLKNIGEGNKAYNRIDMNNSIVRTNGFGQELVHKNINETIKKAEKLAPISSQLIYFTDLHHRLYNYRKYEQFKAMTKVCNHLDIKAIMTGGDNIDESDNRVTAIKTHRDIYGQFKKDKFVYCNGNHDLNIMTGGGNYVHPFHIKPYFNNDKMKWASDLKYYGYMDIEESKLRIVVFDTFETQFVDGLTPGASPNVSLEQIQWHINNSLNLKDSTINKIICVGHISPCDALESGDSVFSTRDIVRRTLSNFKNGLGEFASQGKRDVVTWLFGHEHKDRMITVDGITYVGNLLASSTQVNYNNPGEPYKSYTRELGTEYEFAFDIVSIVESERKVYFHRVGRKTVQGDRVINY